MGYSTSFVGEFTISPPLTLKDYNLLVDIAASDTRKDTFPLQARPYPSEFCDWEPTRDGDGLQWNGREKFYDYVEWLEWLIDKVFEPRGYALSGTVQFAGEDFDDRGVIAIKDGVVTKKMLLALEGDDELDN